MSISEETIRKVAEVLTAHPSIPNHKDAIRDVCPSCPDADVAGPNSPSHAAHQARALAAAGLLAPDVSRADIEKAIRGKVWAANREPNKAGFHRVHVDWATDAVWSMLSGDDLAVFVVRESDLPAVGRTDDGWTDGTRHGWEGTSETAMECVETHLEWARFYAAVARAIEAEQAEDPVEAKARELYEHVYTGRFEDGSSGVQAEYRKIAAYVLGQEAGQ